MNHLLSFFIVIALCVELSRGKLFPKDSVHFKNSLQPKNILRIHCVSEEDDLGDHLLNPGQTYNFSFYESIFTTKVDCVLLQGIGGYKFYALVRAYEGGGIIVHYGKRNFWDAREDGIYFTHGWISPKLEYKWLVWPSHVLAPSQ
ncbi:S-protein homolog 9-like [Raphanus sativus]|uniref:S-protein homolog n=1 Tax=Raphanus sativus TaxID=3726 RepID=A0A9W3CGU2_RAPSA|nr:S-protein homolog 9-like [Raphanus sativus]